MPAHLSLDKLRPSAAGDTPAGSREEADAVAAAPLRATPAQLKQDAKLVMLLRNAVQAAADDEGWARVGAVGTQIANQASFDHRNYGYATLTKLLVASQLFDIADEGKSSVMVRDKRQSRPPARNG
jgi:hypothetical protein